MPALLAIAGAVTLAPTAAHAAGTTWLTPLSPDVAAPAPGGTIATVMQASSPVVSGDGDRALYRLLQTAPFVFATPAALNPSQVVLWDRNASSTPRIISRASGPNGGIANQVSGTGSSSGLTLVGELDLSRDGSTAAFPSPATNLVAGDTNGKSDVFVRELDGAEATELVSVDDEGRQPAPSYDPGALAPALSEDGQRVAFSARGVQDWVTENHTFAGSGWGQGTIATLVRDRAAGKTILAGATNGTDVPVETLGDTRISADGRYVLFVSSAPDMVELPAGVAPVNYGLVYLRDTVDGTTTLVSAAPDGTPANQPVSSNPDVTLSRRALKLSSDGRYAVFQSSATNLITLAAGESATSQTLVWDRETNARARVAVADDGSQLIAPQTSATVAGALDVPGPNFGFQEAEYTVEFGTTTEYGASVSGDEAVAGGTDDAPLALGLSGLQPGTTYHYRVVATNAAGTAQGEDRTFTTSAAGGNDDGGGDTPPGGNGDTPPGGETPPGGGTVPPGGDVVVPTPTRFALSATATKSSLRLAAVRKNGLRLTVGVDGSASLRASATVTASTARRLGLRVRKGAKRVTIGTAKATTKAKGKRTVRITLSKATRTRLARAGAKLAVRVELRATGSGRTATTLVRTLTVRR